MQQSLAVCSFVPCLDIEFAVERNVFYGALKNHSPFVHLGKKIIKRKVDRHVIPV